MPQEMDRTSIAEIAKKHYPATLESRATDQRAPEKIESNF